MTVRPPRSPLDQRHGAAVGTHGAVGKHDFNDLGTSGERPGAGREPGRLRHIAPAAGPVAEPVARAGAADPPRRVFRPGGHGVAMAAVSLTARPLAGRTRRLLSLSAVIQTLILVPLGSLLSRVPAVVEGQDLFPGQAFPSGPVRAVLRHAPAVAPAGAADREASGSCRDGGVRVGGNRREHRRGRDQDESRGSTQKPSDPGPSDGARQVIGEGDMTIHSWGSGHSLQHVNSDTQVKERD